MFLIHGMTLLPKLTLLRLRKRMFRYQLEFPVRAKITGTAVKIFSNSGMKKRGHNFFDIRSRPLHPHRTAG